MSRSSPFRRVLPSRARGKRLLHLWVLIPAGTQVAEKGSERVGEVVAAPVFAGWSVVKRRGKRLPEAVPNAKLVALGKGD